MKNILILLMLISGFSAVADDTVCSPWVQKDGCLFGDGESGTNWARTCSYGSTTCHPHKQDPRGTVCESTTVCFGHEPGDIQNPTDLGDRLCTDWRLAYGTNTACSGRAQRWVRACIVEHVPTRVCAVDQPPNSP